MFYKGFVFLIAYDCSMFLGKSNGLRVHCWGGLGSQLYAWALLEDIVRDFPNRKVSLVLHNSGVTKRESDLDFLCLELSVTVIDDFKEIQTQADYSGKNNLGRKFRITKIAKLVLQATGFLATANTNNEYRKIRSWTTHIRGHYSHRTISKETLLLMKLRAERCGKSWLVAGDSELENSDELRIHIRLGDLLTLKSKGPLAFERVFSAIDDYKKMNSNFKTLYVASDSPEIAIQNFREKYPQDKIIPVVEDPWRTISILASGATFIGTNSKLSVWIAILIFNQDRASKVSLPNGSMNHLRHNLDSFSEITSLSLY
jgi:hypothetical protein